LSRYYRPCRAAGYSCRRVVVVVVVVVVVATVRAVAMAVRAVPVCVK